MGQIDFYAYLDEDSEGSEETEETTLPLPVKKKTLCVIM